jgi:hypothetical protein
MVKRPLSIDSLSSGLWVCLAFRFKSNTYRLIYRILGL